MTNLQQFEQTLTKHYGVLFNRPDYAFAAVRTTPDSLTQRMTASLLAGTANKDGEGIKRRVRSWGLNTPTPPFHHI